jgi:hypothetical protein
MNSATLTNAGYLGVVDRICALNWSHIDEAEITRIAWVYYYFSVQFRENLEIACNLYPDDMLLMQLAEEECDTANLSPWPGVAEVGERLNHDVFMSRLLQLSPMHSPCSPQEIEAIGRSYLQKIRALDQQTRAMSVASFEDGGLARVFASILTCQCWGTPLLQAFRYFLMKHITFDGDSGGGHGALARHLMPDERIRPLWEAFYSLFVDSVPRLKE